MLPQVPDSPLSSLALPMRFFSPLTWLHRLPPHVLNGLGVALGIGLIQWLFGSHATLHLAQLASSGAVFSSLADVPTTPRRSLHRVLLAAVLGALATWTVAALDPYPRLLGLAIMGLVFLGMMTLAWGPRAGPVSFAAVLAIVFTMGVPPGTPPGELLAWTLAGSAVYLGWAQILVRLLQPRYRSLALATALDATAQLLRSRAGVVEGAAETDQARDSLQTWVRDEAVLAERLQAARDLLFAAPDSARARRDTGMLLRAIDLRDILLASRLDLELLGNDELALQVRAALAARLRHLAYRLDQAQAGVRGLPPTDEAEPPLRLDLRDQFMAHPLLQSDDRRARLLPALVNRVQHLADDVDAIHALLRQGDGELPLTRKELQLFVAPEGWPLSAFKPHLSLASPVLRHALRAALALGAAYYIALALPWTAHPQWLVLSVAVVLRGNLEQTLSRRNIRVLGTLLGCLIVMVLAHVHSPLLLTLAFLTAVGLAHSFAVERYLVTASAATVMALLQAHLAHPAIGFPIAERLGDTLLGALMAWAFCFVLPSWERRALPRTLPRLLQALRAYAHAALAPHDPAHPERSVTQRLARRQAYDALALLATALQRSSFEPRQVQLPLQALTRLLDHAQRLMAHLSMLRMMQLRGGTELQQAQAQAAVQAAQKTLDTLLTLGKQPAGDTDIETQVEAAALDAGLDLLPEKPLSEDVMPWMNRRLQVALRDAARVASSAREALAELRRPPN